MNSLRFYRELPVNAKQQCIFTGMVFLDVRSSFVQEIGVYVATSAYICPRIVRLLGKPSNVLKFSTKVSSSIHFDLLQGLLFGLNFLILKLHMKGNGPQVFNSVGQCQS